MNVFPGEIFAFSLNVLDQNNNEKNGFYTYPSNMLFTEADVTEVDLTADNEETSFAVINRNSNQRTSLVVRNSTAIFSFSAMNQSRVIAEKGFTLNLIDSSTGNIVCQIHVAICMLINVCNF